MNPLEIKTGSAYSSGDFGNSWYVWQVVDIFIDSEKQKITRYRVMAGENRRKTFSCLLAEFSEKVRYEVKLNENSWRRVG
ncbi:MAG: hypothetical protein KAS48_06110 [Gammaproteobacteria bacterium]|nr:hypothetical protein [Gammaproteobacteria bacterium]MCK5091492.1 hypothetical protein [Gammaproteobacteria bacterium]